MKHFVIGFLFDPALEKVHLIQKNRPKWQEGHYNGIGGHIEDNETPKEAMQREFIEEAGIDIDSWQHCVTFTCKGGTVFVFKAVAATDEVFCSVRDQTDESIVIYYTNCLPVNVLYPLNWMVPMLLDDIAWPITFEYDSLGGCKQEAESEDDGC